MGSQGDDHLLGSFPWNVRVVTFRTSEEVGIRVSIVTAPTLIGSPPVASQLLGRITSERALLGGPQVS